MPMKNSPLLAPKGDAGADDMIDVALETVRTHLGMAVAYLSEFVDGRSVFRAVSAPGLEHMIQPGDSHSLEDVYCQHILDGRLPNVIPDTQAEPIAKALPITDAVPIGSHVSVPVHREDGSVYGMFCCLSPAPNPTLNPRDLDVMETFANLAKAKLHDSLRARERVQTIRNRIEGALAQRQFQIALQPIFPLGAALPAGFEALCRFSAQPYRPPNLWFDEAKDIGKQIDLEVLVLSEALKALSDLPDSVYLSVNAAPETVSTGRVLEALDGHPAERVVIEVTEHSTVEDDRALQAALQDLAFRGARIAIDDVGAGYSGLSQILKLRPHLIKLDMALIRDIGTDVARQSLVRGLVHFAQSIAAQTVAEGIETPAELATLQTLGIDLAQGYHLGKPADLDTAKAWFAPAGSKAG